MLKIIHLSDTHLFADVEKELLGVNTEKSFQAILNLLQTEKQIHCIIHSGDLSQDGSTTSYLRLASSLKKFNNPLYYIPGNHDNPASIEKVYPCGPVKNDKQILLENWQCILLNSQKKEAVEGYLDETQLLFLQKCLTQFSSYHTIIFLHHHPLPIHCQWLNHLGLTNKNEFWEMIKSHQQVKAVFFGHIHQELNEIINGVSCYSVPSTCIQFQPNQDTFSLDHLPPGYRWISLEKNGSLETGVKRITQYVGHFDPQAKGY